jgi:non-ribosomal peptide synthetase component F
MLALRPVTSSSPRVAMELKHAPNKRYALLKMCRLMLAGGRVGRCRNIGRMSYAPHLTSAIPPVLLHQLPQRAAACWPTRTALTVDGQHLSYADLQAQIERRAGLQQLGLERGARVVLYLDKRVETVVASFAAPAAGAVLVPVNPLLKPTQVAHILQDAGAQVLITSAARLASLAPVLGDCPDLRHVLCCDGCRWRRRLCLQAWLCTPGMGCWPAARLRRPRCWMAT